MQRWARRPQDCRPSRSLMRITPYFPEFLPRSADLPACSSDNLRGRTDLPRKYLCFSGTNFGPAAPSTGTIPRSRSALYRSCRFSSAPLRHWDTSRFSVCSASSESPPLMPFSIRGNGFPIKEFYFQNSEKLCCISSKIMLLSLVRKSWLSQKRESLSSYELRLSRKNMEHWTEFVNKFRQASWHNTKREIL